jgi:hypothetical protein
VGEILTVIGRHNLIKAVADFVTSARLIAAKVTVESVDRSAGAVYRPEPVTVPRLALPPAIPLTAQLTAEFAVPVTATVNCCAWPATTSAIAGEALIEIPSLFAGTFPAAFTEPHAVKVKIVAMSRVEKKTSVDGEGSALGSRRILHLRG